MIEIGKILKPWGLKGEIKVKPYNEEAFKDLKEVFVDGKALEITKLSVRMGYAYLKIAGVDTPESAEVFRGEEISADKSVLGKLNKDEYLIDDMLGLLVLDDTGVEWGKIVSIEQYGSADVYTVVGRRGENRFPFLDDLIKNIDLKNKVMTVFADKLSEVVVCG